MRQSFEATAEVILDEVRDWDLKLVKVIEVLIDQRNSLIKKYLANQGAADEELILQVIRHHNKELDRLIRKET